MTTSHTPDLTAPHTTSEGTTAMTTTPTSTSTTSTPARKRRRVFMWSFLVIQLVFLAWIIGGIASSHGATTADVAAGCLHGAWEGLFKSQADCLVHYRNGLNQAAAAGTAIGAGLVIGLWVAVDVILGIGRLVVLTARKHRVSS